MVEVQQQDLPRATPAWPPGHQYGLPCKCQQIGGKKRMRYIQPSIPISYKPLKVYRPPEIKMPDGTTYNMSYEAFDPKLIRSCRGKPSFTKENLTTSGSFSDKTTHKMSYGAWPNLKRPEIKYPKDHKLVGEGPISEMTTNRHDYTPKPLESIRKIIQPCALGMSKSKMENDTIHTMSYKFPDMSCFEPPQSYKPIKTYFPPDSPLEAETVHRLSYMPWELPPKEDMPWTKKGTYQKPCIPLDGNTIYNGSYIPPGRLEEDPLGHCIGCYCLTPIECLNSEGDPPKNVLICPEGVDPNVVAQRNADNVNNPAANVEICPDPNCRTEAANVDDKKDVDLINENFLCEGKKMACPNIKKYRCLAVRRCYPICQNLKLLENCRSKIMLYGKGLL